MAARVLGQMRIIGVALGGFQYDVARVGRFVVSTLTNGAAPLTLMIGWTSMLKH